MWGTASLFSHWAGGHSILHKGINMPTGMQCRVYVGHFLLTLTFMKANEGKTSHWYFCRFAPDSNRKAWAQLVRLLENILFFQIDPTKCSTVPHYSPTCSLQYKLLPDDKSCIGLKFLKLILTCWSQQNKDVKTNSVVTGWKMISSCKTTADILFFFWSLHWAKSLLAQECLMT